MIIILLQSESSWSIFRLYADLWRFLLLYDRLDIQKVLAHIYGYLLKIFLI